MLPYLNPLTIIMIATLPVEVMTMFVGPLFFEIDLMSDIGYQHALLANNIFILFQTLGLVSFYKLFKYLQIYKKIPYQRQILSKLNLVYANWVFIGIFLISMYFLASAEFGVINWMINPREGYQGYRSGYGPLYALSMSSLAVAVILACLRKMKPVRLIFTLIMYMPLAYMLGTKAAFLNLFLTVAIMIWFTRWKWFSPFMLIGTVLIFILMLFNFYMSNGNINLITIGAYFDHYRNAADYYNQYLSGDIDLFYGDIFTTSYYSYIPRAIWPDKPYAYGAVLVNEIFFPGAAARTNTPAFGGAVPQFADFSWAGIIFYGFFSSKSILTAFFTYLIFKSPLVDFRNPSILMIILLIMQFSLGFGRFFPGFLYLFLVMAIISILNFIRRVRVGSK